MPAKRQFGKSSGRRLYADQDVWLARMERERSASPNALLRAALDYYQPVYESLSQTDDRELQELVAEAAQAVGPEGVRKALADLVERRLALPLPLQMAGGDR